MIWQSNAVTCNMDCHSLSLEEGGNGSEVPLWSGSGESKAYLDDL